MGAILGTVSNAAMTCKANAVTYRQCDYKCHQASSCLFWSLNEGGGVGGEDCVRAGFTLRLESWDKSWKGSTFTLSSPSHPGDGVKIIIDRHTMGLLRSRGTGVQMRLYTMCEQKAFYHIDDISEESDNVSSVVDGPDEE